MNVVEFAKTQQWGGVASDAGNVHEVLVIVLSKATFQRGFIHDPDVGFRCLFVQVVTVVISILPFERGKSTVDQMVREHPDDRWRAKFVKVAKQFVKTKLRQRPSVKLGVVTCGDAGHSRPRANDDRLAPFNEMTVCTFRSPGLEM
jgi:hypothetical protein